MKPELTLNAGVLRIAGMIDFSNANDCWAEGLSLLAKENGPVTIDLSALEKVGSIAVAVLLNWARTQVARGGTVSLANVPEKCRAILRVSGLIDALPETEGLK